MKITKFSDKMRNERTAIYLPELFEELEKLETIEERANTIKEYYEKKNSNVLGAYLAALYHPDVVLDLPETVPPYDNTQYIDYDMAPLRLEKAIGRLGYFFAPHSTHIKNKIKREAVFIQTLESLHKKDAELYESLLLKTYPIHRYPKSGLALFMFALPQYFTNIDQNYIKEVLAAEKKLRPKTKSMENLDG